MDFDKLITGLSSRVFLLHNVHDDAPVVFHTRWAMSYLRGPLTLPQVRTLTGGPRAAAPADTGQELAAAPASLPTPDCSPSVPSQ